MTTDIEVPRPRILLVDDNEQFTERLDAYLSEEYRCAIVHTAEDAVGRVAATSYDVVLLDLDFGPGKMDGFDFLERCVTDLFDTPVVVVTRFKDMERIKKAVLLGAFYYFVKDESLEDLDVILIRALEYRRLRHKAAISIEDAGAVTDEQILAASPGFVKIMDSARKVADTKAPVLLTGETGTGKSMLARWIHHLSGRTGSFVEINAAAIPETLIETEMFGSVPGAFSGAGDRKGMFELANGGTLFLDEIGDVGLAMQRKLLKSIDEERLRRVGGENEIRVDVRVIAATSQNLSGMVERDVFRPELFHRISTFPLHVPPLRERPEDLELLVDGLRERAARLHNRPVVGITSDALTYLKLHDWPGNVRELSNRIEAAVIQRGEGFLRVGDFPPFTHPENEEFRWGVILANLERAAKRQLLLRLHEKTAGNKTEMARLAEITPRTIHQWINDLRLRDQLGE